jgi:hypothetical protein
MPRGKYEIDALFAAVPMRGLIDPRLTDRDVRILAVIAAYDQMSLVTKRGQGSWASHRTMARKVGGTGANESNFSVSVTKLAELGYLEVSRKSDDRRQRVYRIAYTVDDALFWGKVSPAPDSETTLPANPASDGEHSGSQTQYIPQSKRYSPEGEKYNSSDEARFAARGSAGRIDFAENVGAQLAALERALKADEPINFVDWYNFVGSIWELEEHRGRATRLADELAGHMTEAELEQCTVY